MKLTSDYFSIFIHKSKRVHWKMQYVKRNTKFNILSFFSPAIIPILTNYIQFFTKTDIYFSLIKIPKKYTKLYLEYFDNQEKLLNNRG